MKQETKRIIEWTKFFLQDYAITHKHSNEHINQCIDFLDKLPELEYHLTTGGYIQDRNGVPCCAGDKVKYMLGSQEKLGTLQWDSEDGKFLIYDSKYTSDYHSIMNVVYFKKV